MRALLYEFEGFLLDPVRRVLTREGTPVPLPPKALATLLVLVERSGEVVEKEELLQIIWPDTFITEATLTQNIFRLRKALGEEAGEHRFIVTVPGRGYSFVADLHRAEPAPPAPALAVVPPPAAPPPPPEAPPVSEEEDTGEEPAPALEAAPEPSVPEPPSGGPLPGGPPGAGSPRSGARRWVLPAGAALLVIALAAALPFVLPFRPGGPPQDASRAAAPVPRTSIAVLGFRNLSGRAETAWLATALAEMFAVELGVGEKLHTIAAETVTRTKRDLGLTDPENLSPENLGRLRRLLGCDTVLLGSYLSLGQEGEGRIRVDLRLQDTESGETLSVLTGTRSEEELFELVSGLGRDLRETLGTGPVTRTEVASTRASFPAGQEAGKLYSEGLERLRALDTLAARDLLQRATLAEPGFPLSHAALASAWSTLGYDENAVQEAAKALALSTNLTREDRLIVEALEAETRRDWAKAVGIYESLWRFFPDNLEHGLRLANAESEAGRPQQALLTVAALRRLPAPLVDDPRIDLAEAEASAALSDYTGQERAATQAAQKGRKLGARLLTAQALHHLGHALRSLGRQEEALASIQEAVRIYTAAGDRVGVARAIHDIANLLRDRGDYEGARAQYERALEVHEKAGHRRGIVLALTNLGGMESLTANYTKAQDLLQRAVEISREAHDPLSEGRGLSNLGSVLQEQGKLQAAQQALQEGLDRFRSIGNRLGEVGARMSLSSVYLDLGKLGEARAEADGAIGLSRQINHPRSLGLALRGLGVVLLEEGRLDEAQAAFLEMEGLAGRTGHKLLLADSRAGMAQVHHYRGNLAEARQNATAALGLWMETAERQQAAAGRLVLARLALDEGKPQEAEREANDAVEEFRTLRLADGEALAREALAQIFLARGQVREAGGEIRKALALLSSSQNRRARLTIGITSGRVTGAQGRIAEARRELAATRTESETLGFRLVHLDAAFALAELDLLQGNPAGQRALESLHAEASRQGFHLIASRARNLLQGTDLVARR